MRMLVCDPPPADIEAFLDRRRRLRQDRHDEVWEGVLHISPGPSHRHSQLVTQLVVILDAQARTADLETTVEFNLGDSGEDFRVPDAGLHRRGAAELWHPTAALPVEVLSPGEQTWEKLPFYAAHAVDELLIVDPQQHSVDWLALADGSYEPIERSRLIDLSPAQLTQQIDWP